MPPSASLALHEQRIEPGVLDGTRLLGWIVPSFPDDAADNVWIIHFHGSGDNVSVHSNTYDDFRSMGFSVMAPEYPGYLDSPGSAIAIDLASRIEAGAPVVAAGFSS